MYRFAVKNRFYHDKTVAYLLYDEMKREYQIGMEPALGKAAGDPAGKTEYRTDPP